MDNLFSMCKMRSGEVRSDADPFVVKRQEEAGMTRILEMATQGMNIEKSARLPVGLMILELVCMLGGMILIGAFFESAADIGFAEVWSRAWWCIAAGVPMLAVAGVLAFLAFRKRKEVMASPAVRDYVQRTERVTRELREALGVPEDAVRADVVTYVYREGGKKNSSSFWRGVTGAYTLNEYSVFVRNEMLCFADLSSIVGIPLSSLVETRACKKKLFVSNWNKDVPPNSPQYKQFARGTGAEGTVVTLRGYLVMHISDSRGEFEVLIPEYELQALQSLSGLRLIVS